MSIATTGTARSTCQTTHVYTDGNLGSTRNRLRYWILAFEVRPHFQHAPKIQHRCRVSCVESCGVGRIERVGLGWKGDKNPGAGFYLRKAGRPNLLENAAGKYH